jgi:hypothetical protein
MPLLREPRTDDAIGRRERLLDVAVRGGGVEDDVGAELVEEHRADGILRRRRRGNGRQQLVLHRDEGGRVLGDVPALRADERDRVADVPHATVRERGEDRVVPREPEGTGHGHEIRRGEHRDHALEPQRVGDVDGGNGGVRVRAPDEHGVHDTGAHDVRHEASATGEEPRILDALDALPDEPARAHDVAARSSARGVRSPSGPSALLPPSHARSLPVTKLA